MPVHSDSVRELRAKGIICPDSMPFSHFDAEGPRRQCFVNHGQTPERLAERGGLSCAEAVAILECRAFYHEFLEDEKALPRLISLLRKGNPSTDAQTTG